MVNAKAWGIVSILVLSLLGGTSVLAKDRDNDRDERREHPPKHESHAPGQVLGTVKDAAGHALAGALAAVSNSQGTISRHDKSNKRGAFRIHHLPPGAYTLRVTLAGYQPAERGITLAADRTLDVGTIVLLVPAPPPPPPPAATLNITVVESSTGLGEPNASVVVTYSSNPTIAAGMTDGNGFVTFSNQPVGADASVQVVLNDGSGRTASRSIVGGLVSGVNPVTIVIAPVPTGTLTGIVTDHNFVPLTGAVIDLLDANAVIVAQAQTRSDGTYTLVGIAAGTYTVQFGLQGYQSFTVTSVPVLEGTTSVVNAALTPVAPLADATVNITVLDSSNDFAPAVNADLMVIYSGNPLISENFTDGAGFTSFVNQLVNVSATITVTTSDGRQIVQNISAGFSSGVNPFTISL